MQVENIQKVDKNLKNCIACSKNFEFKNFEILTNVNWSRNKKDYSSIHSISSYLAMFTPSLPSYFIKKYSKENSVVMDNFSGRGTTALVCRELNRKFVGNDLNPYAYVLTKFKIDKILKNELLESLNDIEKKFKNSIFLNKVINYKNIVFKELSYYYSDSTLKQLLFLRENYGKKWINNNKNINGILAFALGLMHGPIRKDGSTIYFSVDMPNTISMSPNYVKNYCKKNKLKKPDVNIFSQIKDRIIKKFDNLLEKNYDAKMFYWDSRKENHYIQNNSIDLVITSPPYLSIVNYTNSNWLKLWLLGYNRFELNKIKLSDRFSFNEYISFIEEYLNSIYPKLKKDAKVCLVVGDVFDKNLIEDSWRQVEQKVKYKFIEIYYDYYNQSKKVTNMLGNRLGKATKIDKVLVIEKIG